MKLDKRDHIIEVAERIFGEVGYEGASTRYLATEAGVNIAMLNYYFGSKDGLLKAVLERRINSMRQALVAIKEQPIPTWEKLTKALDIYLDRVLVNNSFHRLIHRELSLNQRPEITETITNQVLNNINAIKAIIQEGIDNGSFRSVDVEMTIASILGTKYYISNSTHISSRLLEMDLNEPNVLETQLRPRIKHFIQDYLQAYLLKK
ncbi:TetR/AcrR family transcriptional regulator [Adhaeribacter radiodurans]|uniref:TetR/AcrR family transcriptional regulator n=1 Tax=Adhaeribacter radiodurans TaxID=2745197 RepID=A0A7L7LC13_9BACT|nr:TetR/AcrR family transcriptional regulator [Adhaeribacter radiodurans]QMU30376.1 TetR/AcrR family transcriptional regulator [Adhaeribacter radiodurans]